MNYKLVAIDCDHTLLDDTGHIPEINKRIIQKVRALGAEVVIATGRNDILARDYAEELGLDNTMISCNGAVLSNVFKNETYHVSAIDKAALDVYFDYCDKNNILFKVITPTDCYTNDEQAMKLGLWQITKQYTRKLKYTLPYYFTED
ncbi:MAG: HAD family phosphatase, partial [Firmicutes bacterium]|nr:HAD family phosphatase [Bacillota bacterium]